MSLTLNAYRRYIDLQSTDGWKLYNNALNGFKSPLCQKRKDQFGPWRFSKDNRSNESSWIAVWLQPHVQTHTLDTNNHSSGSSHCSNCCWPYSYSPYPCSPCCSSNSRTIHFWKFSEFAWNLFSGQHQNGFIQCFSGLGWWLFHFAKIHRWFAKWWLPMDWQRRQPTSNQTVERVKIFSYFECTQSSWRITFWRFLALRCVKLLSCPNWFTLGLAQMENMKKRMDLPFLLLFLTKFDLITRLACS